jgi:hypothetical protein
MTIRLVSCSTFVALGATLLSIILVDAIEFVNIECDSDVQQASKCYAGGPFNGDALLSGTYVCGRRNIGGLPGFAWQSPETICVGTVLGQVIGYAGDTCGCCGGECPKLCSCVCDDIDDKVMVVKKGRLFGESSECISRGRASRSVGSGEYNCVSEDLCANYLSSGNWTALNGTEYVLTDEREANADLKGEVLFLDPEEVPEEETTASLQDDAPVREQPAAPVDVELEGEVLLLDPEEEEEEAETSQEDAPVREQPEAAARNNDNGVITARATPGGGR